MGTGPLAGVNVVELGAIGPSAFATMLLADLGADVIRVDRAARAEGGVPEMDPRFDLLNRGKRSVALDLKQPESIEVVLRLAERADVVTEGFRPGVAERLGLGPEAVWARNPAAVYARMTGWGQDGPLAASAGHDINYLALTGALHAIGAADGPPQIPANLLGDYAGGGAYLVVGILAALREAGISGRGQVVDAAIVDGVSHLLTGTFGMLAAGQWQDRRGVNLLDGGAPFYAVYPTSDGGHMAVGAGEAKFYAGLLLALGLDDEDPRDQLNRDRWPQIRARIASRFAAGTRAEWTARFEGTDWCVTPVLSLGEAAQHPQVGGRGALGVRDDVLQPGVAPRFSRTTTAPPTRPPLPGQHNGEVLAELEPPTGSGVPTVES